MAKLVFGGDIFLGRDPKPVTIGSSLQHVLSSADLRIFNLEGPALKHPFATGINKSGPVIRQDWKSTESLIEKLNIDVVTLANNHFRDFGQEGVQETIANLEQSNCMHVGGGVDIASAAVPLDIDIKGESFTLLNFAENEWASATANSGGANPLNEISNRAQILDSVARGRIVIVLVHAGVEYLNIPTPAHRARCRAYLDQGAALVIGHHPHVVQGVESTQSGSIFYSLGNFIFDPSKLSSAASDGGVLEVDISSRGIGEYRLHGIHTPVDGELDLIMGENAEKWQTEIDELSKRLAEPVTYDQQWKSYLNKVEQKYLDYLSPFRYIRNRWVRFLLHRLFKIRLGSKPYYSTLLNLIRAESHRETLLHVLEKEVDK